MKVLMATLAAAVAQASTGYTDAVFPAPGQHVVYTVHDTLPRGGSHDQTLTLTGDRSSTMTVATPGKAPVHIALDRGGLTRMDRSVGMSVHWLEVTNAVVQAALEGRHGATVDLGPPGAPPVTLAIASAGGTITASGHASLPPPPREMAGGAPQGPPDQRSEPHPQERGPRGHVMQVNIRIVATIVQGRLTHATGEMTPAQGRGPRHSWSVYRKN